MAGIPHDHYKPKTGMQKWFHERLPIASLIYDTLTIPTPKNLNWMWIWGYCVNILFSTANYYWNYSSYALHAPC